MLCPLTPRAWVTQTPFALEILASGGKNRKGRWVGINICGRKRGKERGSGAMGERADPIQVGGGTASQAEDGDKGQWAEGGPVGPARDQRRKSKRRTGERDPSALASILVMSGSTKLHLLAANGAGSRVQVGGGEGGEQAASGLHSVLHSLAVPS